MDFAEARCRERPEHWLARRQLLRVTREALVRLCRGLELPVDPAALSALAALPEHITVVHHG